MLNCQSQSRRKSTIKAWQIVGATLLATTLWAQQASAAQLVDVKYTGKVTDIFDPYGVFAGVNLGDQVSGVIRYSDPVPAPDSFSDDTHQGLAFPVGSGTQMSAAVGSYVLQASQIVFLNVYSPDGLGGSDVGSDFQFGDADPSSLNTSGLPTGDYLSDAGAFVSLYSTDLSTETFPNPPAGLLPLSKYDSSQNYDFFSVAVRNADGTLDFNNSPLVAFELTALDAVPEPSSLAMIAVVGALLTPRRRQKTGVGVSV